MARDPSTDPRPGDAIRLDGETRRVERVENGRVYYGWPGRLGVRSLHMSGWQAWAAQGFIVSAEVA